MSSTTTQTYFADGGPLTLEGYTLEAQTDGTLDIVYDTSNTKVLDGYHAPVIPGFFKGQVSSSIEKFTATRIHGVHYFFMEIKILTTPDVTVYRLVYQVEGEIQSKDVESDVLYRDSGTETLVSFMFDDPEGNPRTLTVETVDAGSITRSIDLFKSLEIDVDVYAPDPITIGSTGGDPYIEPKYGPRVKLPNCDNYYRLLQIPSMQTVVNTAVSRATPDQRAAIRDQTTGLTDYAEAIDDGYFLSQIFVSIRGQTVTIDLEPGSAVLSRTDLPWAEAGVRTGQNTTGILQGTYQARNVRVGPVTLEVRIFTNAQIRNEVVISLQGACPADTSGLLYRNYRPNLFQLGSLTSMETQTRYLKSRRPLTQKAPVNQNEHAQQLWVQQTA